jgi:LacI family transcriptional regulator
MIARQIDGVIWAVPEIGTNRQWLLDQLPDLHVPIVFLTMHPEPGLSIVSVDNYQGAREATEHLIQQGYRHIGHIAGPVTWWEAQQRKAGWSDALTAAGLPVNDAMWVEGNWSSRSGESAAAQLIGQYPAIDAVFAANDQMALSLITVANAMGRSVPQRLAVVGFDGIAESAYFTPPLTTVHQGLQRLGATAIEQLVSIIEAQRSPDNHQEPQAVTLEPVLIVRESSPLRPVNSEQ